MEGSNNIIVRTTLVFTLFIILCGHPALAQEEARKHVATALDNYYSLSLKYDVSIEALKKANPAISSPMPGDTIIIPLKGTSEQENKKGDCLKSGKARNEIYRVALMIPFSLEQLADSLWKEMLDPAKINELSPFRFIQFYHGFMMAADSLRQKGLNVEIYVYDIDHQTHKVYDILGKQELKSMDMIIGPFFKNSFSLVADFAKEYKIPIINPLSARSDILYENPFVFKLLPSVESQPSLVAELCRREFSDHKILLYTANKYQNSEPVSEIKKAIESTDKSGMRIVPVIDYASDSIQGFYNHASLHQKNLVIIYSESEVLPAALLARLSAVKDDYGVSIIGLPEWEKFSNIESTYLISLNAQVFMSAYVNYKSERMQAFTASYRARYFDEPMQYACSGFDAGYFFLGAVLNYGSEFYGCLDEHRVALIQNQFRFQKTGNNGYDNVNWNVLQYLGYSLIKKSL